MSSSLSHQSEPSPPEDPKAESALPSRPESQSDNTADLASVAKLEAHQPDNGAEPTPESPSNPESSQPDVTPGITPVAKLESSSLDTEATPTSKPNPEVEFTTPSDSAPNITSGTTAAAAAIASSSTKIESSSRSEAKANAAPVAALEDAQAEPALLSQLENTSPDSATAPNPIFPSDSAESESESAASETMAPQRRSLVGNALRLLAWTGIFGTTAVVSAAAGAALMLTVPIPNGSRGVPANPPLSELWKSGFRYQVSRPVTLLLMGLDEALDIEGASPNDLVGRTDTMLLVRINPETESINVMSIPRDTRVEIPGHGIDKINQANVEGGAELAAQTVSYNFNQIEIDRYVRVSTAAFREIVDLVGGVEVFVPKPMQYEDKTQGLVIDLESGWQTLNGSEAEQFARFRQDTLGDIGRVQRQQILLKALRDRMINPRVVTQLPQIIRVLQSYIDTNLSIEEMLALAGFGLQLDREALNMVMLPGRFSNPQEYRASYWIADTNGTNDVMEQFFDAEPAAMLANDAPNRSISRLRIAVQNASSEPYRAQTVADHLRNEGFRNVYVIDDWPDSHHQTAVIAQRGDLNGAEFIEAVLGTGKVVADSTGDLDSDITIRVGNDWTDPMLQLQ
ncbi:MAG: LCP family protein [Cyanobacteria bacterium P01_H01_bin.26]